MISFAIYGVNAWQYGPNTDQQTEQFVSGKKGANFCNQKSVWPEKYSDFLFPLFERLQKMSSLFREKTIDTILHMRIIYAEIQNLRKEIFHLLKEKNVFQRLLATILIFSAAFTQTEISSYSDVDKQSRCLCSTNRL